MRAPFTSRKRDCAGRVAVTALIAIAHARNRWIRITHIVSFGPARAGGRQQRDVEPGFLHQRGKSPASPELVDLRKTEYGSARPELVRVVRSVHLGEGARRIVRGERRQCAHRVAEGPRWTSARDVIENYTHHSSVTQLRVHQRGGSRPWRRTWDALRSPRSVGEAARTLALPASDGDLRAHERHRN